MTTPTPFRTVADKLDEARALIEKGWTQGAFGKDAYGNTIEDSELPAVCFCALGAISMAVRSYADADIKPDDLTPYEAPLRMAIEVDSRSKSAIADWNDAPERTQAEVIEAFRKAAELARAEEQ